MADAGKRLDVHPDSVKRYSLKGLLPTFRQKGLKGNRPHMVNEDDLTYFLNNLYPRKNKLAEKQ
jgi:hypothetical protein